MSSKLKNLLLGSIVGAAFGAAVFMTWKAQAEGELTPAPVQTSQETTPAVRWIKVTDESKMQPPKVALSIERNGEEVTSITVYDTDGQPSLVVHPDGNVDVLRGTPDEAARLFWHVVSRTLNKCDNTKP